MQTTVASDISVDKRRLAVLSAKSRFPRIDGQLVVGHATPNDSKVPMPYNPSWRFVCRYTTKLNVDREAGAKPFFVIDSSPYYMGSYWDATNVEGIYDYREEADGQKNENVITGTWQAYGSFITHYDELNQANAKRMYLRLGARDLGSDETIAESADQLTFNEGTGLRFPKDWEHNIYQNYASTHNLPWMMTVDGFIESPNGHSYWEHDKMRLIWQNGNTKGWLSGGRLPVVRIGEVPLSNDISTTQQSTSNASKIDSYGSVVDARGKTVARIIKAVQKASGVGYTNSINTKYHFQIERGRFVYRPNYSCFLTLNRDNLRKSSSNLRNYGSADYVRVFFNNSQSFVDYPQPELGADTSASKWKMIDAGNVASASEAKAIAIQNYEAGKKSSFGIQAELIRESGQKDLVEGGRHGYIASSCLRHLPSTSPLARSNTLHHHSLTAGCLFGGRQNALDGNLDGLLYLNMVGKYGSAEQVAIW